MDPIQTRLLTHQIHTSLLELLGCRINRDNDGDWPLQIGRRCIFIHPEPEPLPHALVFTRAAININRDCVGELHDLNASAAWAKFTRSSTGDVFVFQRVLREGITPSSLKQAVESVVTCADETGAMLQAVYGTNSAPTSEGH